MAVPFQIPNIEQFLPTGANVGAASLPQAPGPVASAPLSYLDPQQSQDFLETIQFAKAPEPQKLKTWQKIVGALGDAIQAMAAVRAGGQAPPVGPFAARNIQMQQQNRQETMSAEEYNRDLKNRISLMREGERLQLKREKEVAGVRRTPPRLIRDEDVRDIGGVPHNFVRFHDPATGEVVPIPDPRTGQMVIELNLGPTGAQPFIQPAIPGVSPPVRIPKTGRPGVVGGITPPAPPGQEEDFRKNQAYLNSLTSVRAAHEKIRAEVGDVNRLQQFAAAGFGSTKYGGAFELTRPYNEYTNTVRSALNAYIVAATGLSFPEAAFARFESEFPQPWDPPDLAEKKFDNVARRMIEETEIQRNQYPAIGGGPTPKKSASERLNELLRP